jgi:hypothetical protein
METALSPLPLYGVGTLFLAVLGSIEAGRRLGQWRHTIDADTARAGAATVEAAVFALLGLLVAFTFSGAMQRWDTRRAQVVEEANDIGTAWLRIDALPPGAQPALRALFRSYLDARLAAYAAIPELAAVERELARANELQKQIWSTAMTECLKPEGEKARLLLLPALNAMIDITTTRTVAARTHPPAVIYGLLIGLLLLSSLMAGFAMSPAPARNWVHMLCFAVAMSIGVYVILDLEFPRLGLIRIDAVDQVLHDLRADMN